MTLPVVTNWFHSEPAGPLVTVLSEPHADELINANIWHVRGRDRDLLVDCGLGIGSLRSALPEAGNGDPVVVVTHAHLDHMGGAHEFGGCLAHPDEPVTAPPPGSLRGPALAAELGLTETLPPLLIDALPRAGFDLDGYRVRPVPVTRQLRDGDRVDLGDRVFTVLHLPGHSPGSIALLDEHDGTLFSGDVIYEGELLDDIAGADPGRYGASLRRLRELPVRAVCPGHGPAFGRQRLHALIDEYLLKGAPVALRHPVRSRHHLSRC
jgi:glyoxylase-like metal-dependent hydrolase (beta-lactamase superfamily II)